MKYCMQIRGAERGIVAGLLVMASDTPLLKNLRALLRRPGG